jgi:beta-N-acetylhexosaminidase
MAGGVTPIVKHVPGHGRALVDSHLELPRVAAPIEELRVTDFIPFAELADLPWAMTAHVVYEGIDPGAPASLSPRVIGEVIRKEIGFDGLLLCDDLSMKALAGDLTSLAGACLRAGCDVVLHCNGDPEEMQDVAKGVGPMSDAAIRRFQRARAAVGHAGSCDVAQLSDELARLLA